MAITRLDDIHIPSSWRLPLVERAMLPRESGRPALRLKFFEISYISAHVALLNEGMEG
jgi:hypothetical protein